MKWWTGVLVIAVLFTSCEKDINLTLHNQEPLLVVDAGIENGKQPGVVLSSSLNYFSTISASELAASFVHNAAITISNSNNAKVHLKEYSQTDSAGFTLYYYTTDGSNPDSMLTGALNMRYDLIITTA